MPFVPTCGTCAVDADAGKTHTVIFVDVDGVLNIGVRDDLGGEPLLFDDANVQHAQRLAAGGGPNASHESVRKLVAINERSLSHGEEGTFASLVSRAPSHVSSVLAGRLAELIRAAGNQRTVVLSSSWRRPQHRTSAKRLEEEIARHLGTDFSFDDRTPLSDDNCAEDRLRCIGDFIANMYTPADQNLRLLVLEDFFITPLQGWSCAGVPMSSTEAAEHYLVHRCLVPANATARLVHTYDEWLTPDGLVVQAAVGLTKEHFCNAMDFLTGGVGCSFCAIPTGCNNKAPMDVDGNDTQCTNLNLTPEPVKEIGANMQMQAIKSGKAFIVSDLQYSKRWSEYLSVSLPWISITSPWSV